MTRRHEDLPSEDPPAAYSTPDYPRPEYPRPDFDRSDRWLSLNGRWEFHAGPHPSPNSAQAWEQSILVPFAWETPASGVGLHWLTEGWYRRRVTIPAHWEDAHTVLHIGAAHHATTVWVDGVEVARHTGGQLPFEIDLTEVSPPTVATGDGDRIVTLLIRVVAPLDKRALAHGKQRSIPADPYDSCSFTPTSGIWQSVWLEARPATYLRSLVIRPTPTLTGITIQAIVAGPDAARASVTVTVDPASRTQTAAPVAGTARFDIPIDTPRRWSPADPFQYQLTIRVDSADGTDVVRSAAGLRTITVDGEHLLLNGQRIWLRGVLDQGYWPDSGLTPPSEQAIIDDLLAARACGFTLVRKHMKLEDPRWLWHADRLGMLVWAEPASTGLFSTAARAAFEQQLPVMVARDGNHPSIVIWGVYNEEWGLDWAVADDPAIAEAVIGGYELVKTLDPTRPVVDNSGWSHVRTDILDWHVYAARQADWIADLENLASGGGAGFAVPSDPAAPTRKYLMAAAEPATGLPNLNSEYGVGLTPVERAWAMRWQTQELRRHDRFSGAIYTELYDIEHEQAGILTATRAAKDTGNLPPADVHADTVLVLDVVPETVGCDLRTAADGTFCCAAHLSHHGPDEVTGPLRGAWGTTLGPAPTGSSSDLAVMTAQPFVLSSGALVSARLPNEIDAARLHLTWTSPSGTIAHAALDVVRGPAAEPDSPVQTPPPATARTGTS